MIMFPVVDGNEKSGKKPHWITGWIFSKAGMFPRVSTEFTREDRYGAWRVRWGFGRMDYRVLPGLYGVGNPGDEAPVLVTANYKLTFDSLRRCLRGIDAWIVVLDTKGVNVWCAAGKGTFGTEELVRRIRSVGLVRVVKHRTIIVPQLGAPGVSAHDVARQTGFKVIYGPVRAADIPAFLVNGCKADGQMRSVTFTLGERLAVTPIEIVQSGKIVVAALIFHILSMLVAGKIFHFEALSGFLPYLAAVLVGTVLTPILLPCIPGRSFAWKGWITAVAALAFYTGLTGQFAMTTLSFFLILPAIASYLALNYTGCTPFTSLSGVKKEMRIALPFSIASALAGMVLNLYSSWRMP